MRELSYEAFAVLHSDPTKTPVYVARSLNRRSVEDADENGAKKPSPTHGFQAQSRPSWTNTNAPGSAEDTWHLQVTCPLKLRWPKALAWQQASERAALRRRLEQDRTGHPTICEAWQGGRHRTRVHRQRSTNAAQRDMNGRLTSACAQTRKSRALKQTLVEWPAWQPFHMDPFINDRPAADVLSEPKTELHHWRILKRSNCALHITAQPFRIAPSHLGPNCNRCRARHYQN